MRFKVIHKADQHIRGHGSYRRRCDGRTIKRYTLEYGETVAAILGWMNELTSYAGSGEGHVNMDLWNNAGGRRIGKESKNRTELAKSVAATLSQGELIIDPMDRRRYGGAKVKKPGAKTSVVVIKEGASGANEVFFDFQNSKTLNRVQFVAAIKNGEYPGYKLIEKSGEEFPASKADDDPSNNLG